MKKLTNLTRIVLLTVVMFLCSLMYSGQVSAQTNVPTEQEAYNAILSLKGQYYEGRPWDNSNYYRWNGGLSISGGYGCAGFAFACSDKAFGDLPARKVYNVTINDVHVGDILRINNDSHSIVVLEKYTDHIVVTEGNFNSSIHWGRVFTAAQVAASDYMLTRYPAGTFGTTYTITYNANGGEKAPAQQYKENTSITLTNVVPTRNGYVCEGWATTPNAATVQYRPGSLFTLNQNTTLYAVWSAVNPVIVSSFPCTKTASIAIPGSATYFKVTAPVNGKYTFAATSDQDTYAVLFNSEWKKIASDDDSNGNSDFKLTYQMEKGKTYYLQARYFLNSVEYFAGMTGTFKVEISLVPDVSVMAQITKHPEDVLVNVGDTVRVSVEAEGINIAYQWQYGYDGVSWNNSGVASGKTANYVFKAGSDDQGLLLRCKVMIDGKEYISNVAKCTVISAGSITQQPKGVSAHVGETVKVNVVAEGNNISYQWQYGYDGVNWNNSGVTSGRTANYSFKVASDDNGLLLRCRVTINGKVFISNIVTCTVIENVNPAGRVVQQPENVSARVGEIVRVNVEAEGNNISYQWQYSYNGVNWNNSGVASGRTANYSFKAESDDNGLLLRCKVTIDGKEFISNTVVCSVMENVSSAGGIMQQPENVSVHVGETVRVSVAAEGNDISYQWQYGYDGVNWNNSGVASGRTANYSFKAASDDDGLYLRCKVIIGGCVHISDTVRCFLLSN